MSTRVPRKKLTGTTVARGRNGAVEISRGPNGAVAVSGAGRVSFNTLYRTYEVTDGRRSYTCMKTARIEREIGCLAAYVDVRLRCHGPRDPAASDHLGWIRGVAEGGVMHEAWRCDCGAAGRARTDEDDAPAPGATTAAERRRAAVAAATLGRRGERAAAYLRAHVPLTPPF